MTSALIPAYNEAERIAATIAALRSIASQIGLEEIVVVDDGSQDDTAARAEAAGADVVFRRANGGRGAALQAAFALSPPGPPHPPRPPPLAPPYHPESRRPRPRSPPALSAKRWNAGPRWSRRSARLHYRRESARRSWQWETAGGFHVAVVFVAAQGKDEGAVPDVCVHVLYRGDIHIQGAVGGDVGGERVLRLARDDGEALLL